MSALADPDRWPSLTDQFALASRMFGERGAGMVADWLADEVGHIDDPAFAKLFTDHIDLPGVADGDYTHRHVRADGGELIGGIRFYGRDTNRPFVEVIAHSFGDAAVPSADDLDRLRDCVATEWSTFAPHDLRLRTVPGSLRHPLARTDVTIHAARHRDMTKPDGRVRLASFEDVEEAIAMVRRRYERVAVTDPALAANISAADPDDLRAWHEVGQLRAIVANKPAGVDRPPIGLLTIAPGRIAWMEGDEVDEEGIEAEHNGHGYAASAQAEWGATVATDRDRFVIGTIDRLNPASRRTAERAGRPALLEEVFVGLA